jgi:hypothetical protein
MKANKYLLVFLMPFLMVLTVALVNLNKYQAKNVLPAKSPLKTAVTFQQPVR